MKRLSLLLLCALPSFAHAANWKIDPAQSHIRFSGTHAGNAFEGRFKTWDALIDFDPVAPEKAKVEVTVDLASASTGNPTYDGTLPEADWLNSKSESTAKFRTNTITKSAENEYLAEGTLMLRSASIPVKLPFKLVIADGTATLSGKTILKRLDFGIGKDSDASGEWVSLDIPLDIAVVAKQTP